MGFTDPPDAEPELPAPSHESNHGPDPEGGD
jgi:hypothetical protein